jgi:hypothetical protein
VEHANPSTLGDNLEALFQGPLHARDDGTCLEDPGEDETGSCDVEGCGVVDQLNRILAGITPARPIFKVELDATVT